MSDHQTMSVQTPPSAATQQADTNKQVCHQQPAAETCEEGVKTPLPTNTAGGSAFSGNAINHRVSTAGTSVSCRHQSDTLTLTASTTLHISEQRTSAEVSGRGVHSAAAAPRKRRRSSLPLQMSSVPPAATWLLRQMRRLEPRPANGGGEGATLPRSGAVTTRGDPPSRQLTSFSTAAASHLAASATGRCTCFFRLHQPIIHTGGKRYSIPPGNLKPNGPTLLPPCNGAVTIIRPRPQPMPMSIPPGAAQSLIAAAAAGKCTCSLGSLHQHAPKVEKRYHCTRCDRTFLHVADLKTHLRLHTGERPYHCKQCDKRFNVSGALKRHQHTHTGEKPYRCAQCDKSFNDMSNLKKHQFIHTGEKPHRCQQCDKRFVQLAHLQLHQRIHTGEKPYFCKLCDKRFIQSGDLKIHKRIHTGEKPYHCKECKRSFTQLSSLKSHQRHIHRQGMVYATAEKPHRCQQCNKSYRRLVKLESHQRLMHTVNDPTKTV